jgi:hypothetical protein
LYTIISLLINGAFPPVNATPSTDITLEERLTAIDFVNRHNFFFEESYYEKIINAFTSDGIVYHYYGTIKGHDGIRRFLDEQYGYLLVSSGSPRTISPTRMARMGCQSGIMSNSYGMCGPKTRKNPTV